jgi:hypothetical protein
MPPLAALALLLVVVVVVAVAMAAGTVPKGLTASTGTCTGVAVEATDGAGGVVMAPQKEEEEEDCEFRLPCWASAAEEVLPEAGLASPCACA